jgi:hypothetical protein
LFVADGLSALLRQGSSQGVITPVKVCPRAPGVSHLLSVDDSLLFFKEEAREAVMIRDIIAAYAKPQNS